MHVDRKKLAAYYMEKEAIRGAIGQGLMKFLGFAGKQVGNLARSPVGKGVASRATAMMNSPAGKGVAGLAGDATKAIKGQAKTVADTAAPYVSPMANRLGGLGQTVTTGARRGLNKLDDFAQYAMSGPGRGKAPFVTRFGDSLVGKTDVNPLSVRNLGIGAGTVAAGAKGVGSLAGMVGGGGAAAAVPAAQQAMTQTSTGGGAGAGGFLSNMPREMQYALAAGVPLALLGAYAGGRGNMMSGMGLGALGLGAAGLGAAGAGYLGDDARRFVGQGAHSLMGLFGAGKDGDMMGQIEQLSQLSPEFGVTMLMGRNKGLSREEAQRMYEFLTQNKDSISKMMPQVTGAQPAVKAGAAMRLAVELDKAARCWKGYEPVPGKKPYSNDSCRPVGSKKKKKEKTANVDPRLQMAGMMKMQSVRDLEKEAFGGLVGAGARMAMKGLPMMARGARGLVQGAGKLTGGVGNAVAASGRAINAAGAGMGSLGTKAMQTGGQLAANSTNPAMRFLGNTAGALSGVTGAAGNVVQAGGRLAQGIGNATAMGGKGLQMAGNYSAAAVPLAGAGTYGAYQAARPMLPSVQFQSPVKFQ